MNFLTRIRSAFGFASIVAQIPFWSLYFIPSTLRQHPQWTWRQAMGVRCLRALIGVLGRLRIGDDLTLEPGEEKDRFVVMQPAAPRMYTETLACDEGIKPETIGATWYPEKIEKGGKREDVGPIILHFHGGGYTLGDGRTNDCGFAASTLLDGTPATHVLCPQYRLASTPGCRFPAQFQDALTSYLYLSRTLDAPAEQIILSGDSAGGHMVIQLLRYIQTHGKTLGIAAPKAAWLWSPWCDVAKPLADPTILYTYPQYPTDFLPNHDLIQWTSETYPPRASTGVDLTNPYVSPLGHPFKLPCRVFAQVGDAELNYKEVVTWVAEMTQVEGKEEKLKLEILEGAPHDILKCGHLLGFEEEARAVIQEAKQFTWG